MKDYEKMSDFDINKAAAILDGLKVDNGYGFADSCDSIVCYQAPDSEDGEEYAVEVRVNYCGNPQDAWPIIVGNKINFTFQRSGENVLAHSNNYEFCYTDTNALRAAMIVFLMMNKNPE